MNHTSIRSAAVLVALSLPARLAAEQPTILKPADYAHYVEKFNTMEPETVVNLIPNAQAWDWMVANIPRFDCPDKQLEETYYFRWWSFRKHIVQTPSGRVITEFLTPVSHAGPYNTISCALGHHIAEGRWLHDKSLLDEYIRFWFRSGPNGGPAPHFHKYSSWATAANVDRYFVTGDRDFVVDLLNDLVADYGRWEAERLGPDGLFWQYDVQDGMEESISGGRRVKNIRPTINSYMIGNARAISLIAGMAGRSNVEREFKDKADSLEAKMVATLWDPDAKFFKVKLESGKLSDAREAIGFIPWMFDIPGPEDAQAWKQLRDPQGFCAPFGLTTAERRHPAFRTRGTGKCEWDGPVWPFATSQTLTALAKALRAPDNNMPVTKKDYFEALLAYSRSQQMDGKPYIGEYLDETDGHWLITGSKAERSRYYNHSTLADLIIAGIVGVIPRADDTLQINPLLPEVTWDWFCLDGVLYRDHTLTIVWDRGGEHYHRGAGLALWIDGHQSAKTETLSAITAKLPQPR